ncbi:MAG TPA: alpha/beta hydrolase [Kofleriaceae bacterium]|nr:alpha/beta hydrolase [Kofleriaceae bacterium]
MDAHAWRQGGALHRFGDLDLFYRRAGAGPALVCIHGFPTSSHDFAPLWEPLSARFDVVAHDLVGLGWSAKPRRPLTVGLQADAALGLLAAVGIERAHLLAHDLGDTVAQELLARQIDGVAGVEWISLTLLNGGLFPETHRALRVQELLLSPVGPLVARAMPRRRFDASLTRIFGPDTPPSRAFLDDAWFLLTRDGGRAMLPRLIRYMVERREKRERWVGALTRGVVPTRLIAGALDPISGRHMADRYRELVPEPDVVLLERLGHYPHVEDPAAVLAAFLAHPALSASSC